MPRVFVRVLNVFQLEFKLKQFAEKEVGTIFYEIEFGQQLLGEFTSINVAEHNVADNGRAVQVRYAPKRSSRTI